MWNQKKKWMGKPPSLPTNLPKADFTDLLSVGKRSFHFAKINWKKVNAFGRITTSIHTHTTNKVIFAILGRELWFRAWSYRKKYHHREIIKMADIYILTLDLTPGNEKTLCTLSYWLFSTCCYVMNIVVFELSQVPQLRWQHGNLKKSGWRGIFES